MQKTNDKKSSYFQKRGEKGSFLYFQKTGEKKVRLHSYVCLHVQEKRHGLLLFLLFSPFFWKYKNEPTFLATFFCIYCKANAKEYNKTTSRFEARLVFKHTQKPNFLISNAR